MHAASNGTVRGSAAKEEDHVHTTTRACARMLSACRRRRRAGRRARHQAHHHQQGLAGLQRPIVWAGRAIRNLHGGHHRRGRPCRPPQRDHPGHSPGPAQRARHGRVHGDVLPDQADRHEQIERHPVPAGAEPRRTHRHRRPRRRRRGVEQRLAGRHDGHASGTRHGPGREESRWLLHHGALHIHDRRPGLGQPDQRGRQHRDDLCGAQQSLDPLCARDLRYDAGGAHELRDLYVQHGPAHRSASRPEQRLGVRRLHVDTLPRRGQRHQDLRQGRLR